MPQQQLNFDASDTPASRGRGHRREPGASPGEAAGRSAGAADSLDSGLSFEQLGERYRRIVEGVSDVVLELDGEGRIVSANGAGERALEKGRGELVGLDIRQLVHADDVEALNERLESASEPAPDVPLSLRLLPPGGEREYSVSLAPSGAGGGGGRPPGTLAILRDVSGRRRLKEQVDYAERLRAVGDILSKITHEVKNPRAAIQASAEFLRRHWDADEESKLEAVGLIADEVIRVNTIITDFLRIRRIPQPQMVDEEIGETVGHVTRSLERLLEKYPGIELSSEVLEARFVFDPNLVKQMLWNLVNNAIEAIGERGSVEVVGQELADGATYELRVADNGAGMSGEEAGQAFEPFFTTKKTGTGLGLALVRMHAEAMGGSVGLESSRGKGTAVSVRLPLRRGGG